VARWRKLLAHMLSDASPRSYSYDDAAAVLSALGFELAPHGGGSHRKWRRKLADGNTVVVVGLVQKATPLKPYLIREMISQLREHGLVPDDLERS
jgi:hypothetical protein